MFNEQQKVRYIDSLKSAIDKQIAVSLMSTLEKYEDRFEKDVCLWGKQEISTVIEEEARYRSTTTQASVIRLIKRYMRWCENNGVSTNIGDVMFFKTSSNHIGDITFASPDELQQYLDAVFKPVFMRSSDNICRAAMWMAFIGLSGNDAVKVLRSDYNTETQCIEYNGTEFPVYKEAAEALLFCKNSTTIIIYRTLNGTKTQSERNRSETPYLLFGECKSGRIGPAKFHTIVNGISARLSEASENGCISTPITYNKVYLSGLFYRVYEQERIGIPPRFDNELAKRKVGSSVWKIEESYLMNDYNNWKEAHGLE